MQLKNLLFCGVILLLIAESICRGADFYVSPDGHDDNPGSASKPFATIERARNALRDMKLHWPPRSFTIQLRGGVYRLKNTIVFEPQDGAPDGYQVTCEAYPDEIPVLSGSIPIPKWHLLKPEQEPPGITEQAKGKLWAAEIPAELELFKTLYDGETELLRARSKGFLPRLEAFDTRHPQASKTTLHYPARLIKNWNNLTDVELLARPWAPWSMNILPLAAVDEANQIATTVERGDRDESESSTVLDQASGICRSGKSSR